MKAIIECLRAPRWAWFVLGTSVVLLLVEARDPPVPEVVRRAAAEPPPALEPWRMSARELRRLPGIGQRLALAIVQARDEHEGVDLAWQDVPGIGPATEAKVRGWLHRHGTPVGDLGPPRPPP